MKVGALSSLESQLFSCSHISHPRYSNIADMAYKVHQQQKEQHWKEANGTGKISVVHDRVGLALNPGHPGGHFSLVSFVLDHAGRRLDPEVPVHQVKSSQNTNTSHILGTFPEQAPHFERCFVFSNELSRN